MELDITDEESKLLDVWSIYRRDCWIAGGFLRDTILGKPIKDIDVYVGYNEEVKRLAENSIRQGILIDNLDKSYDKDLFHYAGQIKGTRINFLVPIDDLHKHFATFDIGLCKVYYDIKEDNLVVTDDFKRDVENKTITLMTKKNTDILLPNEQDHLHRVRVKYPDYIVRDKRGMVW